MCKKVEAEPRKKLNSLFLVQKLNVKNSTNLSQLILMVYFLSPAEAARNFGVWFDSDFSLSRHVQNIFKSWFAQIQDLKCLRGYRTSCVALMDANALVGNQLD